MLDKFFKVLDDYRNNITNHVDISVIEEKQKELKVKFPQAMVEFYIYFGNDEEVLSSFYVFDKVRDIRIEYDAVSFGEKHERYGRLGIQIEDLGTDDEAICWYSYDKKKWYLEESEINIFFFNIASWQVLNTMSAVAKVCLPEEEFKQLVGTDLKYLSDDELFLLGDIIPIYGNGVLGCYLVDDEELYLGAKEDDILEKYEEVFGLDLDWL